LVYTQVATDLLREVITVHAYTPRAVRQAIEAGVKCIDHGHLLDEATAKLMADKGIWWSLQPFLDDEPSTFAEGSPNRIKQLVMFSGTDRAYTLAKKFNIKTAWGTDTLFSATNAAQQGASLAKMVRWYTPAEVLKMATSTNGELLALSGLRSPYPGKIGVIEEGALADLLLVDGNPLENIRLVADPAKNFLVIMKDGKMYKNSL
jgi:imidazolonepropionase-like amidohydrolase